METHDAGSLVMDPFNSLPITGHKLSSLLCAVSLQLEFTGEESKSNNDAFVWRRTASRESEKAKSKAGNQ